MTNNLSKQKDDKTERISITTSDTTRHQEDIVINIGDSPISPSMEPPRTSVGWRILHTKGNISVTYQIYFISISIE